MEVALGVPVPFALTPLEWPQSFGPGAAAQPPHMRENRHKSAILVGVGPAGLSRFCSSRVKQQFLSWLKAALFCVFCVFCVFSVFCVLMNLDFQRNQRIVHILVGRACWFPPSEQALALVSGLLLHLGTPTALPKGFQWTLGA